MADMLPLEWIAAALIAFSVIKLVVVSISMPAWFGFARRVYARPTATTATAGVLAGVVLYILVGAGVTIIEILAVTAFVFLVMVIGIASYAPDILAWAETRDLKDWLREQWLSTAIWLGLMVWGLFTLATGS